MKTYRLSHEARLDFFAAFDFIAGYSERTALRWEPRMVEAFDHLATWPLTGVVRAEFGPADLRFWVEGDYIVIYDSSTDPVYIIAILHGAQDLTNLIAKRLEEYDSEQE